MDPRIGVGIGVFLFKSPSSPQFILGKRKGSHGAGTWSLPGGHLDYGETFEACAAREILEETGLRIKDGMVEFLTATNSVFKKDGRQYATIFMMGVVDGEGAEPQNLEPDKCEEWVWRSYTELKEMISAAQQGLSEQKVFLPLLNLEEQRPEVSRRLEKIGV